MMSRLRLDNRKTGLRALVAGSLGLLLAVGATTAFAPAAEASNFPRVRSVPGRTCTTLQTVRVNSEFFGPRQHSWDFAGGSSITAVHNQTTQQAMRVTTNTTRGMIQAWHIHSNTAGVGSPWSNCA